MLEFMKTKTLLFMMLSGCSTQGPANSELEICNALIDLTAIAISRRSPIEASVYKEPGTLTCGDADDAAVETYCSIVTRNTSLEFVNSYPWAIRTCISNNGALSTVQKTDDWSGYTDYRKKKIVEIEGKLKSGIEVRLLFKPNKDNNLDNYYGQYKLTLTPAQSDM